jgi:hypothetical protein
MGRVYRVAGFMAVACGAALILTWLLLGAVVDPDGRRTVAGDAGGLGAIGIFLVAAGAYLARGKSESS